MKTKLEKTTHLIRFGSVSEKTEGWFGPRSEGRFGRLMEKWPGFPHSRREPRCFSVLR
ncbi:MAG: hypothetical protein GY800_11260 [Planctomycetes bacterium]|nr:hypothetical protein [Planctomycetota bacterium]